MTSFCRHHEYLLEGNVVLVCCKREEQERLEREAAAREIEEQRQRAVETQIRREEEKREEARRLKETLEQQMDELKEREADVRCYLIFCYFCHHHHLCFISCFPRFLRLACT